MENKAKEHAESIPGRIIEPARATAEAQRDVGVTSQQSEMVIASTGGWERSADVKFVIVKWLYAVYIFWNIADVIACIIWFALLMENRYTQGIAWVPWIVLPVALFFNRLAYEIGIALFEAIKHLRQIRDELRSHNANPVGMHSAHMLESRLDKLADLKTRGIISEAEYNQARDRIVSEV